MTNKPIAVGDLVVLVKPCECGHNSDLGRTYYVEAVETFLIGRRLCCGAQFKDTVAIGQYQYSTYRLRRIPPLADLDGVSEDARIAAPVKERA